jgi:glycosyltransferase involved in cell wall biosynthesis
LALETSLGETWQEWVSNQVIQRFRRELDLLMGNFKGLTPYGWSMRPASWFTSTGPGSSSVQLGTTSELHRGHDPGGMKVMHVVSAMQLGGAESVAINLAIQHATHGVRTSIVTVRDARCSFDPVGQHFRELLHAHRIPLFEIGSTAFRTGLLQLPLRMSRLIEQESPDLVHSHTDVPDFVVSAAQRLRRFPVVRTIHSTSLWDKHRLAGMIAEQGLKDDLIIGVSQDALSSYRDLRRRYRLQPSRHQHVISNGVRLNSLSAIREAKTTRRMGDRLKVAYFGRSAPAKGLDVLIRAILPRSGDAPLPIELFLFSDADRYDNLKSLTDAFPCPVHVSPPVPNAAERMIEFDILVVPSRLEGFGLVAREALAAHTPVIATRIPGLREALPQDWPLLVEPDDSEGLRSMLLSVARGDYDLDALGRAGYNHASQYSIEAVAEEYLDSYRSYLTGALPQKISLL